MRFSPIRVRIVIYTIVLVVVWIFLGLKYKEAEKQSMLREPLTSVSDEVSTR